MVRLDQVPERATEIPNFNPPQVLPTDIVKNIRRMLKDLNPLPMTPWYKGTVLYLAKVLKFLQKWKRVSTGYNGTIKTSNADSYVVSGDIAVLECNE